MKPSFGIQLALALAVGLLGSCDSQRSDPPPAQPSSTQPATSVVRIRAASPFTPACVIVEAGATIEWRNLTPRSPSSVVSVGGSRELSSPALRDPYNSVPVDTSDECVLRDSNGCVAAVPFSFWRHTFTTPGIFDYRDASGSAVAAVGGYGLPAGPQTSGSAAVGTVCVRSSVGSTECDRVCCTGTIANECGPAVACVSGRCGGVSQ